MPSPRSGETRGRARTRVFPVERRDDAVLIAHQAGRLARQAGFTAKRAAEIAIVASELASNIAKHGIRGDLSLILEPHGALSLVARDIGPPIRDLAVAVIDGCDGEGPIDPALLPRRGGLGTGLGAVLRLGDRFDAQQLPEGKEITVRFFRGNPPSLYAEGRSAVPATEGDRAMPEVFRIGSHTTWLEEPDLIVLRLAGDVSLDDAEEINRRHFALSAGRDRVFMLVDMLGLGSDTPAGRKVTSQALNRMPVRGLAVCQARVEAKVMAKMVVAGISLFKDDAREGFPVEYFEGEAAARAWIDALRGR